MVIIFIKIKARPEKLKELTQTLLAIVEQVRKETDCLHSGFYQDVANVKDFLMVEEWATQKVSDAHLRSDLFTVILGDSSLMYGPPEVVIHTVSHSTEFETGTPKPYCKQ